MDIQPVYPDPFNPVLLSSYSLELSDEQDLLIKEVLAIGASDIQFAQKMYDALHHILTSGPVAPVISDPVLISLVPDSAEIGDPSFTLHVHGAGLVEGSVINFAGHDEPTTHVSNTHVTTGVDMSVWLGADVLPVYVKNPSGVQSNTLMFTFAVSLAMKSVKSDSVKSVSSSSVKSK